MAATEKARSSRIDRIAFIVSCAGAAFLLFMGGMAAGHYRLSPSVWFDEAVTGFNALVEQSKIRESREGKGVKKQPQNVIESDMTDEEAINRADGTIPGREEESSGVRKRVKVYQAGKAYDGYTLFSPIGGPKPVGGSRAFLLDMKGNVLHQWQLAFRDAWPKPPHVKNPIPGVSWFTTHVYPNGDLIVSYDGWGDTPYGYGIVKMDKNSKVIWKYSKNVHHAFDVGPDGKIYALTHELRKERVPNFEYLKTPVIYEYIAVLSPEGKELKQISIMQAFHGTPYEGYAYMIPPRVLKGDLTHANSIYVLKEDVDYKLPVFKPGRQVLVSVRRISALAVIDLETEKVVWAVRGPWREQHDPEFIRNGNIMVFDNKGHSDKRHGKVASRVVEFDPVTQATPWLYSGTGGQERFFTAVRGSKQVLPNDNVLITESLQGRIFEVNREGEIVWEYFNHRGVFTSKRYPKEQLTFLKPQP